MDFKDLRVWQDSHKLTLEIYKLIRDFPDNEKYGIVSQLKRAAYSIPSNIAEGYGRKTSKEFINFIVISRGSLQELRYFLILTKDLEIISNKLYNELDQKYLKLKIS